MPEASEVATRRGEAGEEVAVNGVQVVGVTRVGLLKPMNEESALVVERLRDRDRLRKARIHPVAVLAALVTYGSGHGARGQHAWEPVREVVDALDEAFYLAFEHVEPTNKRVVLALDVSRSMG
jgi:60 kDa SS-A/Ro ribonucleoprotein